MDELEAAMRQIVGAAMDYRGNVPGAHQAIDDAKQAIRDLFARRVVVTDAMVERAARVIWRAPGGFMTEFDDAGSSHRDIYRALARTVLIAALGDAGGDAPVERTEGAGRTQWPGVPLPAIDGKRGA